VPYEYAVYAPPLVEISKVHAAALDDHDTMNASPETVDAFVCENEVIVGLITGAAVGAVTV
jgi:hypothetical protein